MTLSFFCFFRDEIRMSPDVHRMEYFSQIFLYYEEDKMYVNCVRYMPDVNMWILGGKL